MNPHHRALGLLTLGVMTLVTATSVAEEADRSLAILELRQGLDSATKTAEYLRAVRKKFEQENKDDAFTLVSDAEALGKIASGRQQVPGAITAERIAALEESKKKGLNFLWQAKPDLGKAIKTLSTAESKFRAALAASGATDALRKSYLDLLARLASAHFQAKENDKCQEVFRHIITTFGPEAKISDDNYRPDVVAAFKGVVEEMKKMPRGAIDVVSSPSQAKLILNNVPRGETPHKVDNLVPGDYSLQLQLNSTTSLLHKVRVNAGETTQVKIDLAFESHLLIEDDHAGLSYRDLAEARKHLVNDAIEANKELGVHYVVGVGIYGNKLYTFVVDTLRRKIVRSTSYKVGLSGVSKRAVKRSVATMMGRSAGGDGGSNAWYTSVPGWSASGVGLVSLIVGLANVGYLNQSGVEIFHCIDPTAKCAAAEKNDPANQPIINKAKADYRDEVATKSTISGVGLGLGVALIGVGGYLFYRKATAASVAGVSFGEDGHTLLPPKEFGFADSTFTIGASPYAGP